MIRIFSRRTYFILFPLHFADPLVGTNAQAPFRASAHIFVYLVKLNVMPVKEHYSTRGMTR